MFDLKPVSVAATVNLGINFDHLGAVQLPRRQSRRGEAVNAVYFRVTQEQLSNGVCHIEDRGLAGPVGAEEQVDIAETKLEIH